MADPQPQNIILIVDDEQTVLRAASMVVSNLGFRVIVAENGAAGLESFITAQNDVVLVVTDVVMPFMSGLEMADRILALSPHAKILLMSGYSDKVIQPKGARKLPLLRKPFLPEDLMRAILAALDLRQASQH